MKQFRLGIVLSIIIFALSASAMIYICIENGTVDGLKKQFPIYLILTAQLICASIQFIACNKELHTRSKK